MPHAISMSAAAFHPFFPVDLDALGLGSMRQDYRRDVARVGAAYVGSANELLTLLAAACILHTGVEWRCCEMEVANGIVSALLL